MWKGGDNGDVRKHQVRLYSKQRHNNVYTIQSNWVDWLPRATVAHMSLHHEHDRRTQFTATPAILHPIHCPSKSIASIKTLIWWIGPSQGRSKQVAHLLFQVVHFDDHVIMMIGFRDDPKLGLDGPKTKSQRWSQDQHHDLGSIQIWQVHLFSLHLCQVSLPLRFSLGSTLPIGVGFLVARKRWQVSRNALEQMMCCWRDRLAENYFVANSGSLTCVPSFQYW